MKLIVDANVIIAALIRQNPAVQSLLEKHKLHAPKIIEDEILRNIKTIEEKTRLSAEQISHLLFSLLSSITFHSNRIIQPHTKEAKKICPDPKDIQYFALALTLNCPLWSNDKALKQQDSVRVITTQELLTELE